jgi:hypothetical protein
MAVVEGDLEATEKLIAQLKEVPTPSGQTPREITDNAADTSDVYENNNEY